MKTQFRWQETIRTGTHGLSAWSYAILALLIGSLGYWASTAPLSGAVVAQGAIAAAGRNVLVQHPEGGVVKEILVSEGDVVTAGQPLILLDPTTPATMVNRLRNQARSFETIMLRLRAERDGLEAPETPAWLTDDTEVDESPRMYFEEQRKEFDIRLARFNAERDVLLQRIAVYEESVAELKAQQTAVARQLEVIREEMRVKKHLLDRGLTSRTEYALLLRSEAELIGQSGGVEAQLASSHARIVEGKADLEKLLTARVQEAIAQLNDVRTSLIDVQEQIVAAEVTLARTTLRAPADGIIVWSVHNAVGSVLAAGEKVFEILPTLPSLIVEARITPNDIRRVHPGQDAKLRLVALNLRLTPEADGTVIHVSADRLVDHTSNEPYYLVRLKFGEALPSGVTMADMFPGMPVEALVQSDSRTFLEYLAKPLLDSFHRAFTEE